MCCIFQFTWTTISYMLLQQFKKDKYIVTCNCFVRLTEQMHANLSLTNNCLLKYTYACHIVVIRSAWLWFMWTDTCGTLLRDMKVLHSEKPEVWQYRLHSNVNILCVTYLSDWLRMKTLKRSVNFTTRIMSGLAFSEFMGDYVHPVVIIIIIYVNMVRFVVWLTVHRSSVWNKKPTRCHLVLYLFILIRCSL